MSSLFKKAPTVLIGTAIGDALGAPFECKEPDDPIFEKWDGSFIDSDSFHNLKAGQWTDDTGMAIALAKSLIRANGFDPNIAANHYVGWANSCYFRGAGRNTKEAISNLKNGMPWTESGKTEAISKHIYGSGPSMRIAPIGFFYRNDLNKLISAAEQDAMITHNGLEPKIGAIAVALGIALLSTDKCDSSNVIETVIKYLPNCMVKQNLKLAQKLIKDNELPSKALRYLGNDGNDSYLIHTNVATAFYCVATSNSFFESVCKAIRAGFDADTNGAVTGALYAAYKGFDCFNSNIDLVFNTENICKLLKLEELLKKKSEQI